MFSFYGNSRVVTNSWVTELHEQKVVVVVVYVVYVVVVVVVVVVVQTLCSSHVVIWKSYCKTINQQSAEFRIDF